MSMDLVLLEFPIGKDGRETVAINVTEIASMRSHVVTSYSYVDYTEITLKNGTVHDCRISYAEARAKILNANQELLAQ